MKKSWLNPNSQKSEPTKRTVAISAKDVNRLKLFNCECHLTTQHVSVLTVNISSKGDAINLFLTVTVNSYIKEELLDCHESCQI